jgi:formylglycine-generating enzyme required for sulfatase activity
VRRGNQAAALLLAVGCAAVFGVLAFRSTVFPTSMPALLQGRPVVHAVKVAAAAAAVVDAGAARGTPAPSCPEGMVLVSAGRFFMGSDEDLPTERPAHRVTLRAFCIDRTEVTSGDYRACSDRGDCKRAGKDNKWAGITGREQRTYDPLCTGPNDASGRHPINCVDWSMADRFCRSEGKRLPTEAEWEYAARGSDGRKYPWGDAAPTVLHLNACGGECAGWLKRHGTTNDGLLYAADDGWPTTAPVGSFPAGASRWGAEDMVGNVWEWVGDWYGAYSADDQIDPSGPGSGGERVIRGGAWNGAYTDWVRPTFRYESLPDTRSHGIGFRCAAPLPDP